MHSGVAVTDRANLHRAVFPAPVHDFVLSAPFLHILSVQGSDTAHYFSVFDGGYNQLVPDVRWLW